MYLLRKYTKIVAGDLRRKQTGKESRRNRACMRFWIPVALASSTRKAAVMEHLDRAGITAYFQKIVCGDMVEHGKPAPDIYLKVCGELGVAPGQAMAVEDSFNGIRAAHTAGLYTVMVPDQLQPTEELLTMVDKKCDSLMELQEQLPQILK